MASFVSSAITFSSVGFFLLGLIFSIVGYVTFWLIPREEYAGGDSMIDGVGLRQACFTNFRFTIYVHVETNFVKCYDNTKRSAAFEGLPEDVWSPDWFQTIQDMHLAAMIMMILNLLFIGGFLAIFFYVNSLKKKRLKNPQRKPISPGLRLLKCASGLWFILTLVLGLMQLSEPLMFYTNYQRQQSQFYYGERPFDYGTGFGMTIGAGLALLTSAALGLITFIAMVLSLMKKAFRSEEQASRDHYQDSELDRLSKDDAPAVAYRTGPDGKDEVEVNDYKSEPNGNRKSQASVSELSPDGRPVPKPRSRQSLSSREPSVSVQEVAVEYAASPTPADSSPRHRPPESVSAYSGSSRAQSLNPKQFLFDYQPGVGYVPKSARPVSEPEGPKSAQQRSPFSPPGRSSYYNPGAQRSYAGSIVSDSDSVRTDRNRSAVGGARQPSPQPPAHPDPVTPKTPADPKKSRYAAAGW